MILGALIAVAAVFAPFRVMAWEERANLALGVWRAIFPWGLRFIGLVAAMCSAVIARVVLAVLALWTLGTDKDIGGGWSPAS